MNGHTNWDSTMRRNTGDAPNICRDIQTRFFGPPYYIADPDDFAKFEAAGGHGDKCSEVVARAARLAVTFILEHELLSP